MSPRDHSYFQDLLEQHVSGIPLPPDARLALFDHIETCDDCRQMLEAEERITARMKTVPRLVAPSDLRSKILSQAVRDHRERTTTPSDDPGVADLIKGQEQSGEKNAPPKSAVPLSGDQTRERPSRKRPSPEKPSNEIPVFAGVDVPRPTRLRRAWRRASPVLATGFLIVAGMGALYTGQFQGIPFAGTAQQALWNIVDATAGGENIYEQSPLAANSNSPAPAIITQPIATAGFPSSVTPLPGTHAVTGWITDARALLASADSTVAALARASEQTIPAPAEQSVPQIAALVLKPTDHDSTPGGFHKSELAAALEAVAEIQPGGRIARQDQFAMDGRRYRLYTLDLPAGCARRIVQTLTPYKTPADGMIVNALATQSQVKSSGKKTIQFYSTDESRLRSALERIKPVSNNGKNERVRVVVVE